MDNVLNWLENYKAFDNYVSIVKLENKIGQKHAVLLEAEKDNNFLEITLTDPLSEKDSEFKIQLNTLQESMTHKITNEVQIIYKGCQDKDYGTCADMCLIMLQEIIETSPSVDYSAINLIEQQHPAQKHPAQMLADIIGDGIVPCAGFE